MGGFKRMNSVHLNDARFKNAKVNRYVNSPQKFRDPEFPCNNQSLVGNLTGADA